MSPAEQTIQRYQPPSSPGPVSFPTDALTNFQSSYPLGFSGYMFCGATDRVFRSCNQHGAPGSSTIIFKHLFAHKPPLHKKPPHPHEILPAKPGTPVTQSFPVPAHLSPLPPALTRPCPLPPPSPVIVEKRARFMVQIVKSFSTHTLRPSPGNLPPVDLTAFTGRFKTKTHIHCYCIWN